MNNRQVEKDGSLSPVSPPASRGALIASFAAVYTIWGSTYLAIRYAVQTIPPFLMGGMRFVIGGAMLYVFARLTGERTMGLNGWKAGVILGLLLIVFGNGGIVWAEQRAPSGIAAVLVATVPLWIALIQWALPGGKRPPLLGAVGISLGFFGTVFLIRSGGPLQTAVQPLEAAVLLGASISWSLGTVYARHARVGTSTTMTTALQMLCGGAILLCFSAIFGEWRRFHLSSVSAASFYGFFYLIIFGGFVGFTAYNYLVKSTTSARVSTYAYVNPAVAVFLGWAIASEPVTGRMLLAIAIIIVSVILITRS